MTIKANCGSRAMFMRQFEHRQAALYKRVAEYVNQADELSVAACLDATFGRGASLNCLLASNGVERTQLASRLAAKASAQAAGHGPEIARVTFRDKSWTFDAQSSVLDLPIVRRVNNDLKKLGASTVGVLQLGCLPGPSGGFQHVPQVKAVVFGTDLRLQLPGAVNKLQHKYQRVFLDERPIAVDWLDDASRRSVFTQVAELFGMGDPFREVAKALLTEPAAEWHLARTDRALRRYQVLTMCALDKLVMATGELGPILEGALREGTSRARKLYARSDKPLHRDQIVHFWLEQHRRRGETFVLPFVKAR